MTNQGQHERTLQDLHTSVEEQSQGLASLRATEETLMHTTMPKHTQSSFMSPLDNLSMGGNTPDWMSAPEAQKTSTASSDDHNLVIAAEYRPFSKCRHRCSCVCHAESSVETPSLIRSIIGHLFIGYVGIPSLTPKCESSRTFAMRLIS